MGNNPYNEYLKNKIMTATPGELTLMLYEGAVKFGNISSNCHFNCNYFYRYNF